MQQPPGVKTIPQYDFDTLSLRVRRYWHRHPFRAFYLMRAMMEQTEAEIRWPWPEMRKPNRYRHIGGKFVDGEYIKGRFVDRGEDREEKALFRKPPQPYAGGCPMCGGTRYAAGWHTDWDGSGKAKQGWWHVACGTGLSLMQNPANYWEWFAARQDYKCALSGAPLDPGGADVQIDHLVPLYRVYRDYAEYPVHKLVTFWGPDNLRAVTRQAHVIKSAFEARERAGHF